MPGRNEQFQQIRPKDLPAWRFFPIVQRMSDKIAYAKKRWGCTIFYIDTNGTYRPVGEENKFEWRLLAADVLKRLMDLHPDVLLIPEIMRGDGAWHAAYWAYCSPYFELDYGGIWQTPEYPRKLLPGAFSIVNVNDGPIEERRADLVNAVRHGDILMCRGWFGDSRNDIVKAIYQEAGRER